MNLIEKTSVSRNYGIDLLRILSMMSICILHVLNHGGIISASADGSPNNLIVWFMFTSAYCSVNCYALISGYVGYGSNFKYSRIISLYFQVVFYILTATAVFAVIEPGSVHYSDFIKAFFPFGFGTYWYFSAYFCLFFFIPFLNYFIEKASAEMARKLIFTIFVLFTILPMIFHRDLFFAKDGYTPLWLAFLYLIGAYIKKYKIENIFNVKTGIIVYIVLIVISWGSKFAIDKLSVYIPFVSKWEQVLINYTSPTIFCAAVILFLISVKLYFPKFITKLIAFFSPAAFGVYLIHEEPLIKAHFISGKFTAYADYSPVFMVLAIIGTVFLIWLIGSLIDRVRLELFRLIRVREFSIFLEKSAYNIVMKIKMRLGARVSKRDN